MRVVPDAFPAKTGLLVGTHGALVLNRGEDADGDRERGGEYLILEQCQSGLPNPAAAMLLRRDEEVEIPSAGLEILRQRFSPQRCVDGMRVSDRLAVRLDDAAERVR